MAQKTTAELTTENTNNIADNSSNSISPKDTRDLLQNIIDSMVNKSSDSSDLATNAYKQNNKALTNTNNIQITFATDFGTANYTVFFRDPSGVLAVATSPHDILSTGFQVDGTGVGTIDWLAIIDNDT